MHGRKDLDRLRQAIPKPKPMIESIIGFCVWGACTLATVSLVTSMFESSWIHGILRIRDSPSLPGQRVTEHRLPLHLLGCGRLTSLPQSLRNQTHSHSTAIGMMDCLRRVLENWTRRPGQSSTVKRDCFSLQVFRHLRVVEASGGAAQQGHVVGYPI